MARKRMQVIAYSTPKGAIHLYDDCVHLEYKITRTPTAKEKRTLSICKTCARR